MKRTYEVLRLDPQDRHLCLTVKVSDVGACWSMIIKVPWEMLLDPRVSNAMAGALNRAQARTMALVDQGLWE